MKRPSQARRRALRIVWTALALRDLQDIGDFIAHDNPKAAEAWVAELAATVESIAGLPHSGRVVPELGREGIREVLRRTYRIVYRVRSRTVEVLTVFEGRRLLPRRAIPKEP
ncbi:type II toxin-antitoxin system RelE/ParE family toxin [Pyxidicoccus parkwayensis]|uniref:Type II toxin-antitoxin system RelE/ParE family toxin n=1 Tax=Pyxidicoccus parkwayensis TaxID=2813578 RepID=A0ABX7P3R9_9BACT|nr:type II toxin-antitoxin system RelE/ParE family toxin [Pyxidicoccus parkwaysis]